MKKQSTLAQQVLQAQKTFDSWPDSRKSVFRLEGSDMFLERPTAGREHYHRSEPSPPKKKVHA